MRNLVPSPNTRHGSSGESQTRPVPGFAESAARVTGTIWKVETCRINKDSTYYYP